MTGAWSCQEFRAALGVHAVGATDPADRALVDSHLAWCTRCLEELAGLAALPGRLGSVPAADVTMLVLDEPGAAGRTRPARGCGRCSSGPLPCADACGGGVSRPRRPWR